MTLPMDNSTDGTKGETSSIVGTTNYGGTVDQCPLPETGFGLVH